MPSRPDESKAGFFWQGVLIVLPVLLLAGLGLVSLRQDRRLIEQEAQQRARELVQQLSLILGQRVGSQLAEYQVFAGEWDRAHSSLLPAWPGSALSRTWETTRTGFNQHFQAWSARYPHLRADRVLIGPALVSGSGELISPRDWAETPCPPPWWVALSLEQRNRWQAARALECTSTNLGAVAEAWQGFRESELEAEARANADLAALRLSTMTNSAAEAVQGLCRFAEVHQGERTETGLPLAAITFAMALHRANGSGLTEDLFNGLLGQVALTPSLLTSHLLTAGSRLAETSPPAVRQAVAALIEAWSRQERVRELVRALRQRVSVQNIESTNLWLDAASNRWLVLVVPGSMQSDTHAGGTAVAFSNGVYSVQLFPKPAVEKAFADAVTHSGLAIPAYFGLRADLSNEPLVWTGSGATPRSAVPSTRPLATARLPLPIGLGQDQPEPARPEEAEAESSIGHPALSLGVYLADARLLYARQRQRTLWFGAVILAITLAAVIGFVRAWRAYLREHQLGQLKTNFVSSVSHEFRAPLASVRLMAESLERGKVPDPAKQREYFGFIVQECRRLSSLVANVLDFSRIEQGRKQYEFEPTDLAALITQTVQVMQSYATEREVQLQLDQPGEGAGSRDGPYPVLDGRALQQALVNLVDNAIKHSPRGSAVRIGVAVSKSPAPPGGSDRTPRAVLPAPSFLLWVEDQGPGIPPGEHERIFERFYRLGPELRRETRGVGIGLSIVKHIVEAHRGRVHVESEVGHGSRFVIEVPMELEVAS